MSDDTDRKVVPPSEGHLHGYWGWVPDQTPNEAYTVTGQAGATADASDAPTSAKPASKGATK